MYEPTLDGVLRGLFGRSWRRTAPRAMGVGTRWLMRLRAGRGRPSLASLEQLESWARKLPAALEASREAAHARIETEFETRRREIAGATTGLRSLLLERKKLEDLRQSDQQAKALQRRARRQAEGPAPRQRGVLLREGQRSAHEVARPGRRGTRRRPRPQRGAQAPAGERSERQGSGEFGAVGAVCGDLGRKPPEGRL